MTTVAISDAYKPIEIDLWGAKFETADLPRSKSRKALTLTREVNDLRENLEEADWDELVEKIGEGLDLRLVAIDGGRKKPSALLKAKWKADAISLDRIFGFLAEIPAAEFANAIGSVGDEEGGDRPTPA